MFAQLGAIVFQNQLSFDHYSKSGSAIYAEHSVIEGKPRLQQTGNALDELEISMRLHVQFCDPLTELKRLKQYKDEGEILPLLWGNGIVEGNFVITEISEQIEVSDKIGNVISFLVSCVLKEYSIANKLQADQERDIAAATAVGDKKPVAQKKVNPKQCQQIVTKEIMRIDNHSRAISAIVLEKGSIDTNENKNELLQHLRAIKILTEDLIKRCNDVNSCVHGVSDLQYRTQQVFYSQTNFNQVVTSGNNTRVPAENQILLATVRNLKVAGRPLIQQAITRS